jgi:quercetin dioxygenase-like cupin family protein
MMRSNLFLCTAVSILLTACAADSQGEPAVGQDGADRMAGQEARLVDQGPEEHLMYRPDDIDWQDAPASLEVGAQVAVLEGNPAETGVFTMRIRMPDGYHISPHWHPNVERVTVVSGVFRLGSGEELDREGTEPLEAGSYTSLPPETTHYAVAEGETVIQLTSVGPWVINYVHPEDDPRTRE